MSNKKLSQAEITKRLVRLRNLEKLHRVSKQMRSNKDKIIALQSEQIDRLEKLVGQQDVLLKTQAIRIAELETMVFGKKKRPPMGGTPIASAPSLFVPKPKKRSKDSYRRPLPSAHAITEEVVVPLPESCACGGSFDLEAVTVHDRFREDIPLPDLTKDYRPLLVTKYVVRRGVCLACSKATTSTNTTTKQPWDLGGAQVGLGPNVRLLVVHLVSLLGMSYNQVAMILLSLYGLTISDGEIAKMLATKHKDWQPAYQQLGANIRAAPITHADETPWPIQQNNRLGYAWVLAEANSPRVYYTLEQSRGAVYAQRLFGQSTEQPFAGVRISDDLAAYRNPILPGHQQLCWAHPYRNIRDLYYNINLPKKQLSSVRQWYQQFAEIYQDLRQYLDLPYDLDLRQAQSDSLWQRIQELANRPAPKTGEPDKLRRLKAQLLRAGQDRLLICLPKDTPCDNNRAERDLRQLVLKRKRSFGSQTEKGAKALATVLSLCTTTWRTNPETYFRQLALLG